MNQPNKGKKETKITLTQLKQFAEDFELLQKAKNKFWGLSVTEQMTILGANALVMYVELRLKLK